MNLPQGSNLKNLLFIILGVIIVAEVGWGIFLLTRPKGAALPSYSLPIGNLGQTQSAPSVLPASITLQTPKTTVKLNEEFKVAINLESNIKSDGVDVIIKYDPNLLTVVPNGRNALTVSSLFNEVPINSVDSAKGMISVSGITSETGGVTANGEFGTVTFRAKAAGKAKINLDFTSGSTTDTNVTDAQTHKDVLGKVNNLEVTVQP